MKFGAGLPLRAMGDDGIAVRDFAQALDGAGFDFVTLGGHLLSAEPGRYPERLGHQSTAFTMDIYGHLGPTLQAEAAEEYDRLLRGN